MVQLTEAGEQPGSSSNPVIPVYDPSTEDQIGEIRDSGVAGANEGVARARESFESGVWNGKPPAERAKILWKVADLLEQRADELAAIDSRNLGMAPHQARTMAFTSAELVRYHSGWCTKIHGKTADLKMRGGITGADANMLGYTLKEPIGVVAAIVPWNGPVFNAVMKFAPALAAGCSMVLKPAEETPLSAAVIGDILAQAGVPEGVVNIVNGYGHTVGARLAAHPDVDKVAFTGSTEVGKMIIQASAGNLKRLTLELGGKTPVVIFNDADLPTAIANAAIGVFMNSGQACVAGSRIYVQRGVYDQVVEGVAKMADALRLGGPQDGEVDIGPLISGKQRDRVMGIIEQGKRDGAELVTGGTRLDRRGYFIKPTVFTGVRPDMQLFREEIFGPVVAIMPFDDEEEVVASANDSEFGLAAAICTQDITRAHRLAKRLQAGTVWLNCQFAWDVAMPFGGYKQSGWGYESGIEGVEAYMKTKSVYVGL